MKILKRVTLYISMFLLSMSLLTNQNLTSAVESAATDNLLPLELTQQLQSNKNKLYEPFNVKYSIKPQEVYKNTIDSAYLKDKEIVLVVDTSGSMDFDLDGIYNKLDQYNRALRILSNGRYEYKPSTLISRMEVVKAASNRFINSFPNNDRIKLGLVQYSSRATINNGLTNDFQAIKNSINSYQPGGGTNLGDGLRKAFYMLKHSPNTKAKKYIVLLTDGSPTFYSYYEEKGSYKYVQDQRDTGYYNNESNDFENGEEYSKRIAQKLQNEAIEINSYMIGFTRDAASNKLQSISSEKDKITVKQADKEEDIDAVYNEIAREINYDIVLENPKVEINLPTGLEIAELPSGFVKVSTTKAVGTLQNINYTLVGDKYVANPVEVNIKIKGNEVGNYNLNSTAKLTYRYIDSTEKVKYFNGIDNIEIYKPEKVISILEYGTFFNRSLPQGSSINNYIINRQDESVNLVDRFKNNLGILFKVEESYDFNLKVTLNRDNTSSIVSSKFIINNSDIILYKVKEDGSLVKLAIDSKRIKIETIENKKVISIDFSQLEKGKNYIVSLGITPTYLMSYNETLSLKSEVVQGSLSKKELEIWILPLLKLI